MPEKHPRRVASPGTGPPLARSAPPLLVAKLTVAPLAEGLVVSRRRLWERIEAGIQGPITLVSAPAGWGKTVLLASWCRSGRPIPDRAGPPAWLTIAPGDHGPRFWPYLAAALRATAPPGGRVPDDPAPGGYGSEVSRLESVIPGGFLPESLVPDGLVPDRLVPDGLAPESFVPDVLVPDRLGPDRLGPDCLGPDRPAPDRPALDRPVPGGIGPAGRDSTIPGPDRGFLEELAADLARRPEPVVLVLDDVHRAGAATLVADLDFLVRHAGDRLRLVLAARTDPALALHRWRLSGELTEIHAEELAFTAAEVGELLAAHETLLPAEQTAALHARTEGWAAGLRFAALALRGHPDPARLVGSCTGDGPPVADYLTDEVLAGLPGDAREALVRGAVTEQLHGGLLDALTGRTDGEELLAGAARSTGFLVPLGAAPGAYRCHRMLRDLLRAGLRRLPAQERLELHRRAAGWYAAHGRPALALRHTLAAGSGAGEGADSADDADAGDGTDAGDGAGDGGLARRLLRDHWADLVPYCPPRVGPPPGTAAPTSTEAEPAPPPGPAVDPELALAYAAERLNLDDPAGATGYLRRAAEGEHLVGGERRDWFAAVGAALRLARDQLVGDASGVRAETDRLIGLAGSVPGAEAVGRTVRGASWLSGGDLARAERELADGLALARQDGLSRAALVCAGRLALAHAVQGRLRAAEEAARSALDDASGRPAEHPADIGYAHLARAVVALHRDLPDDAAGNLSAVDVDPRADRCGDPVVGVLGAIVRARLCRDRGDLLGAGEALAQGRRHLPAGPPSWPPAGWLLAAEADLRTAAGDPAGARDLLQRAVDGGSGVGRSGLGRSGLGRSAAATSGAGKPGAGTSVAATSRGGVSAGADAGAGGGVDRRVGGGADGRPGGDRAAPAPIAVALARAMLAGGDPHGAQRLLPGGTEPAGRPWPLALRLEAGLLAALAARALGDGRGAARQLEEVLGLAEPEGFRRIFTRAEPPVRELLAAHLDSGTAYWPMVTGLLAEREPPAVAGAPAKGAAAGRSGAATPLREPLTERELTILRYLQSILSNVEIAAELSLSVNTVKTHVRNIYRKLETTRRREAVRRARELRLI